ncbi:MAG: SUMF1/EgtB/PvdO family nonheme iron enzyme [Pirellulaceae bacterium]|nr:SUMF1/EgtB/PvdO family nonheme iron enzyme [Pirellulaceae bacterium]
MNDQATFDTLLSHNSADKPAVEQLAVRLRDAGVSVWFDKWNLSPGEPWQDAIERALADSRSVAVFLGPDGLGPWHQLEMRAALSQQVDAQRGFRVIPVLLPGATAATSANLPAFLKQLTWVQFRDTLDDAEAWQRLLAGIRGQAPGYVPAASAATLAEDSGEPIVPRGLRAFDERDQASFLRLLPGARDRLGLPASVGFWKDALEQIDAERTFRVGLIYGPSGCGKSSLVRAGLIPNLAEYVLAIHLDATPDATEHQLLQRLRKRLPGLPSELDLPGALAYLRQDAAPLEGRKLVLILDQFEQWLHAHPVLEEQPLLQALAHCDGGRLQAVVMVRDEFFLAIDRFMDALDVPIRKGINMALVDLFAPDHARHVLAEFGRVYGGIPDREDQYTQDQKWFLERAIAQLADADGRVVSVRIALFADMVRDKPWTTQTLRQLGGVAGVGVAFLEENFDRPTANPEHRAHRPAAMAVLKALLPEAGTDIKGGRRAQGELLRIAGYEKQPAKFERLLQILDSDLRIITPVESAGGDDEAAGSETVAAPTAFPAHQPPTEDFEVARSRIRENSGALREGQRPPQPANSHEFGYSPSKCATSKTEDDASSPATHSGRFYQLTHDYLVGPLRQWLTRRQRETLRGRALLRLEERTAEWMPTRQRRFLPNPWEYVSILCFAPRTNLSEPQRSLLRAANRFYAATTSAVLLVLLMLTAGAWWQWDTTQEQRTLTAVKSLLSTSPLTVPAAIKDLRPFQSRADKHLREIVDQGTCEGDKATPQQQLHALYGLADAGDVRTSSLIDRVADGPIGHAGNFVTALRVGGDTSTDELRRRFQAATSPEERVRHATVALHLGELSPVRDMLPLGPDPTDRTAFVHGFPAWHGELADVAAILQRSGEEVESDDVRSGLCSSLGLLVWETFSQDEQAALKAAVETLYRDAPDGGTHSAAVYALNRWNQPLPDLDRTKTPPSDARWFVNSLGMTMIRVPAGTFWMGSDSGEPDVKPRHPVTLTQPFYVCDREVTVALFTQFLDDNDYPGEKPQDWSRTFLETTSPTPDSPVAEVFWEDAVLFCNWLSQREDCKPCYWKSESGTWEWDIQADGYRLPTEAEWEYVCRATSDTAYCFGDDPSRLVEYGYSIENSGGCTWPAGSKLPNGWGLFDMHGNVWEWCYDWYAQYGNGPQVNPTGPEVAIRRVDRGGSWNMTAGYCRSASRYKYSPDECYSFLGFRVARVQSSREAGGQEQEAR